MPSISALTYWKIGIAILLVGIASSLLTAQSGPFYLGADLSYTNEMQDCEASYFAQGVEVDPYALFAERGSNLVRLRLWHTPSWYETISDKGTYSNLADVKWSISRAFDQGMEVLLDFHLSDTWADPGNQIMPLAWEPVADDLELLEDSLYNYIYSTLESLNEEGLLPQMVQIGNETNKGILLTKEKNDEGWSLDWNRNAQLFNEAIRAVKTFESDNNVEIKTVIHCAGPENAEWLFGSFIDNGVTDFDIMGLSYYWQWNQPLTNTGTADVIKKLKEDHPAYEVLIVETGYVWTQNSKDNANNVLGATHPDFSPASPENQKAWLIDLTEKTIEAGGMGVIYWEPTWVSTSCNTLWARGSHYENAVFFDFSNDLLENGGIGWLSHKYDINTTSTKSNVFDQYLIVYNSTDEQSIIIEWNHPEEKLEEVRLMNLQGQLLSQNKIYGEQEKLTLPEIGTGIYILSFTGTFGGVISKKVYLTP
ncbi:MAG: glycosyl hydrolase 53 family protein [Bacteroidota bacterium]